MSKLLVIGDKARVEKFLPQLPIVDEVELVVAERGASDEELINLAADADYIMADAISPVSAGLIGHAPKLKLIHSEGVAFNAIDCEAAAERGIFVCNNRGVNAVAVAEQTLLLMLGIQKSVLAGDAAVRSGGQIAVKERMMVAGIDELDGATLGLVGFGDIAREVAKRARAFGMHVLYNKRTPLAPEQDATMGVEYAELDKLLAECDFVSLHVPVTDVTRGMADDGFFSKMRPGSYLINTARGEVVDNDALVRALEGGKIAGAALDTVAPEPVALDNPLLNMSEDAQRKVLFSPHIGGVTTNMFRKAHRTVWENIARIERGERPTNIVNGI